MAQKNKPAVKKKPPEGHATSLQSHSFSVSTLRVSFFLNLCLYLQPFRLSSGSPRWRLACTCHATCAVAAARSRGAASAPRTAAPRPPTRSRPVTQPPARGGTRRRPRTVRAPSWLMDVGHVRNRKRQHSVFLSESTADPPLPPVSELNNLIISPTYLRVRMTAEVNIFLRPSMKSDWKGLRKKRHLCSLVTETYSRSC